MSSNGSVPSTCDVAIIGAGPAGLAAACALREAGVGVVVVLDREPEAGGIPRHCGHYPFGLREFHRLLKGPELARRLVAKAVQSGAVICTGVTVAALRPGPELVVTGSSGIRTLRARRVILATGVRETSRAGRLIGGTKPGGILPTGALQGLVYLEGRRPFSRPVILGTELVSFSALLTCRHAGIKPVAMIEQQSRPTAWKVAPLLPRLLGIPVLFNTTVRAIWGRDRVSGVEVETAGERRTIEADGVIVSGQFRPESSLLDESPVVRDPGTLGPQVDQYGRCSAAGYFAAGNVLRPVETAGWSWQEGCRLGAAVAQDLAAALPPFSPQQDVTLVCDHPALRYVMPQRVTPFSLHKGTGLVELQVRVRRPVNGVLSLVLLEDGATQGRVLWEQTLKALPERRILVPLRALLAVPAGARVALRLIEKAA
jgi:thioredoxin reductase